MRKQWWWIGSMGLMAVAAFLLRGCQANSLYFPNDTIAATPASVGMSFERVELVASDGVELLAWFVPSYPERAVVLLCHGNAGNIGDRVRWIQLMNAMEFSVLAFDYRGYGESGGKPSEEGTYRDAEAAWTYLVRERGVDPSRIVVMGRSMGGAIAANLAVEKEPGALILESAFTSYPDIAQDMAGFFPVRWVAAFDYSTIDSLAKVDCPVLVIHSRTDEVVGYDHGEALFEAAKPPKMFLEITGGHNDGFARSGNVYANGIRGFVQSAMPDAGLGLPPVPTSP
jgi:uncharacterized protein